MQCEPGHTGHLCCVVLCIYSGLEIVIQKRKSRKVGTNLPDSVSLVCVSRL